MFTADPYAIIRRLLQPQLLGKLIYLLFTVKAPILYQIQRLSCYWLCWWWFNFLFCLVCFPVFFLSGSSRKRRACHSLAVTTNAALVVWNRCVSLWNQWYNLQWRSAHQVAPCCAWVANNVLVEETCHCTIACTKRTEYLNFFFMNNISVSAWFHLCSPAVCLTSTTEQQACK